MKAQAISSILVAIDFSPSSRMALKEAARLASLYQARLTAVHVVDPFLVLEMKRRLGLDEYKVLEQIESRLRHFAISSDAGFAALETDVRTESAYAGIEAAYLDHAPDLLVLGAHGNHGERAQIGPVAARCIRNIPAEVLIVHASCPGPFKKIVVCTDLSETSSRAISAAVRVAAHEGGSVDCLHVLQTVYALTIDYGGLAMDMPVPAPEILLERQKELNAFVQPLVATTDVPVTQHVVEMINIRQAVIDHVREIQADLVVLGTRGKSGLREFLLGTTAEKILSNVPCSILAIKPVGFKGPTAGRQE